MSPSCSYFSAFIRQHSDNSKLFCNAENEKEVFRIEEADRKVEVGTERYTVKKQTTENTENFKTLETLGLNTNTMITNEINPISPKITLFNKENHTQNLVLTKSRQYSLCSNNVKNNLMEFLESRNQNSYNKDVSKESKERNNNSNNNNSNSNTNIIKNTNNYQQTRCKSKDYLSAPTSKKISERMLMLDKNRLNFNTQSGNENVKEKDKERINKDKSIDNKESSKSKLKIAKKITDIITDLNELHKETTLNGKKEKDLKDAIYKKIPINEKSKNVVEKEKKSNSSNSNFKDLIDAKRIKTNNSKNIANNITGGKNSYKFSEEFLNKSKLNISNAINLDQKEKKETKKSTNEKETLLDQDILKSNKLNEKVNDYYYSKYMKMNPKEELKYLSKESTNYQQKNSQQDWPNQQNHHVDKSLYKFQFELVSDKQREKEMEYLYPNQFKKPTNNISNDLQTYRHDKSHIMGENNLDKEYIRKKIDYQILNKNKSGYLGSDNSGCATSTRANSRINYLSSRLYDDKSNYKFEYLQ